MTDQGSSIKKDIEEKTNGEAQSLPESSPESLLDSSLESAQESSPAASDDKEKAREPASPPKEFTWGNGLGLDVSATQMSARLEVSVDCAEFYTAADLYRFLRMNKVVHLVNETQLQDIFDHKIFNEPVLVSKGTPPQHGQDGYVDWQVDLSILDGAKLVEHGGRVDWKEQHHVLQVEENDLLGRLISPTSGKAGINVYGQEIPANPGKEAKFPAGKGVRISEDGKELFADMSGVVCRDNEKISVSDTYSVQGDVDLKTGNIHYDETVMISGNIRSDFKIYAGQDIHVNGLVEGASVEAGGNIYINGGIQGDQKAHIKAGGDVTVKFINNATVEVGGNVIVSGSISNSIVRAGHRVMVDGSKAVIVGGETYAEKEIIASILGSELGVTTKMILGIELQRKIDYKNEQSQKINSLMANYKKLQQATNSLNQLRDAGKLSPDQAALRLKIIRSGLQLQAQVKRMQDEQNLAKEEIDNTRKEMVGVAAKQVAWPGTQITILGQQFNVKSQTSKAIFALVKNEVDVFAYKEHEEKKGKKGKEGSESSDSEKKEAVAEALTKIREDTPASSA